MPTCYRLSVNRHRYDHDRDREHWEALAVERGCTVGALIEWHCRVVAWELDEEAPTLQ